MQFNHRQGLLFGRVRQLDNRQDHQFSPASQRGQLQSHQLDLLLPLDQQRLQIGAAKTLSACSHTQSERSTAAQPLAAFEAFQVTAH